MDWLFSWTYFVLLLQLSIHCSSGWHEQCLLLAVLNFVNRGHKRDIKEEQASDFRGLAPFCLSCLMGGVLVALGMSSGALPQLHVQKAHTCAAFVVHTSRPLLCDSQQRCCLLCSWYLPSPS